MNCGLAPACSSRRARNDTAWANTIWGSRDATQRAAAARNDSRAARLVIAGDPSVSRGLGVAQTCLGRVALGSGLELGSDVAIEVEDRLDVLGADRGSSRRRHGLDQPPGDGVQQGLGVAGRDALD